jgi:hypothetical protein
VSADKPLMTMRVSRDSGRTWSRMKTYSPKGILVPLMSSIWPPCECPRCAEKNDPKRL